MTKEIEFPTLPGYCHECGYEFDYYSQRHDPNDPHFDKDCCPRCGSLDTSWNAETARLLNECKQGKHPPTPSIIFEINYDDEDDLMPF